jgi:hypothetical protein
MDSLRRDWKGMVGHVLYVLRCFYLVPAKSSVQEIAKAEDDARYVRGYSILRKSIPTSVVLSARGGLTAL